MAFSIASCKSESNQEWHAFVRQNSACMFQIALLMTADPIAAEAALSESIGDLECDLLPGNSTLSRWRNRLVGRVLTHVARCGVSAAQFHSQPESGIDQLLQPSLVAVSKIDRLPRIAFVLRTLLGYDPRSCCELLGVAEGELPDLLSSAMIQLQQITQEPLVSSG